MGYLLGPKTINNNKTQITNPQRQTKFDQGSPEERELSKKTCVGGLGVTREYPILGARDYPILGDGTYPRLGSRTYPTLGNRDYPILGNC